MDLEETVEQTTPKQDRRAKSKKITAKDFDISDGQFLFDAVSNSESPIKSIITDWLNSFHLDKFTALAELVNFIIKAAGGDRTIPPGSIAEYDMIPDTLEELTANFKADHEYPLVQKGKRNSFKKNYVEFWTKFAPILKSELVEEDGIIPEVLVQWLTSMSSLRFRPFRHTATLSALTFLTGLCEYSQKSHTEWLKVEAQKDRDSQASRKATLQNRLNELTELNEQIEKIHRDIFTGVFMHRIRDIDPAIRQECVGELCSWAVKYSNMYLDAQYLRYLGWMLNDRIPAVRLEALKSAAKVVKPNLIEGSRHFIDRFTPRIIDMAVSEIDAHVRVEAVKVLCAINENELLEEYDDLLHLALDPDVRIRNIIAPVIVSWITNQIEDLKFRVNETNETDIEIKGFCSAILEILAKSNERNIALDKDIVEDAAQEVLKIKESHIQVVDGDEIERQHSKIVQDLSPILQWITKESLDHSSLTFDGIQAVLLALLPHIELLKETEALALYLLNDNSDNENLQLDADQETVLMFSLCLSFTNELEQPKKKSASKKALTVFYQNLIKLMKKYGNEFHGPQLVKLVELVKLIRAIPIESFEQTSSEIVYHDIVDLLIQMFEKHSDKHFLQEIISSLTYLTTDEVSSSIMEEGKKKLLQLVDNVVAATVGAYDSLKADEQSVILNANSDVLNEMLAKVIKLHCIIQLDIPTNMFSESSATGIYDMMNGCLEFALELLKLHSEGENSLWATNLISNSIEIMIAHTFIQIEKLRSDEKTFEDKQLLLQNVERLITFCEAVVTDAKGDIFGISFSLTIRSQCLQSALQMFPIINGAQNKEETAMLFTPRIPSVEFQREANLLVSRIFELFLYGLPVYKIQKNVNDEQIAAFETFIIQLYAGLCGLARYDTCNPEHMAPTLMYYAVPSEKMSSWIAKENYIQPKSLRILESLWNRYSDFIMQKYIGELPAKFADIFNSDGTVEAKMVKVEEFLQQVALLIISSIKKSIELFITAKVPDFLHSEALVKGINSRLKSWPSLLDKTSFTSLVGEDLARNVGSFLRDVHSATKIHLLSSLVKGLKETASMISSWSKIIEKSNQDYDITMQTTVTEVLDDFDTQMVTSNLAQVNDCWNIWGKLGATITLVLQGLDNFDGQVPSGVPSSMEEVIEYLEEHLNEINLHPDMDDPDWKSYFECIESLKSGSSRKKRKAPSGKSRKTPRKKKHAEDDEEDDGSRPVTPKSTRSSRRLSTKNVSYVEKDSDDESVEQTPTKDSFKRKLQEVEFVESPDVISAKKRK